MEVQKKHPLTIRWNHWINFPLVGVMVWSGLCIYWSNPVYGLPASWLETAGLSSQLALGLAWHWPFAVLFSLNGLAYVCFLLWTKHGFFLVPSRCDIKQAFLVMAHDLRLIKQAPPIHGKYNSAQKLAYGTVVLSGALMVASGFALYKPIQLGWLLRLMGGYSTARLVHFSLTLLLIAFFLVHVGQVVKAGWNNFRAMVTGLERIEDEST